MDFEVVWTEPAAADLQALTLYLGQHNPPAAERVATEILERVELLKASPLMGRAYPSGSKVANSGDHLWQVSHFLPRLGRVETR